MTNSSFSQPPRDPSPTRDPNAQITKSPWVPENQAAKPGTRRYEVERGLATIAAIVAGAVPLLTWYGTFDENLLGPKRSRSSAKRTPTNEPPPAHAPQAPRALGYRFDTLAPDEPTSATPRP